MEQLIEFATKHWELSLAFAVTVGMLVHNLFGEKWKGYHSVDPVEAINLINHKDAIFVDVRTDRERTQGHVLNSKHIPLNVLKGRIHELEKHKGKHVVVSCRSGHRSSHACGQLRKNGFEHVYNLRGGMLAWQNANLPVTTKG